MESGDSFMKDEPLLSEFTSSSRVHLNKSPNNYWKTFFIILLGLLFVFISIGCFFALYQRNNYDSQVSNEWTIRVIQEFPHDSSAFSQGLVVRGNVIYESLGLYGSSELRKVVLETGVPFASVKLPTYYFGEGLALVNTTIYQLTWREKIVLVFNETLNLLETFNLNLKECWGLAFDGTNLILSDGTSSLRFFDLDWNLKKIISVKKNGNEVINLNELEFINGYIWANVWHENYIVVIDPNTGFL